MDNGIDWEEIFTAMGLEWKGKLSEIKAHGIHTLQLTDEQKEEFDTVFSGLFERSSVANGREMYSFVARLAVNLCRIMSEVAVLRALESPHPYDFKTFHTGQGDSCGQLQGWYHHPLGCIHFAGRLSCCT